MLAYEELKGSQGRQMYYRPQRYQAAELFAETPPKILLLDSEFKLTNLSLTGAAAAANQTIEPQFTEGELIPVCIKQAGVSILQCKGKVVRLERHAFGSRVAINFIDECVDFTSLLKRNASARIAYQLETLAPQSASLVSADYRAHCADVLHFLRTLKAVTDTSVQQLTARAFAPPDEEILAACEERILPQWRRLWLRGNELTANALQDKVQLAALKEYTELVLTPEFCIGPVWWRSYYKPAGYPGDFQIMNYVYDWQREGKDNYAKLLHRIGLDVSECIATRMHVVKRVIAETLRAHACSTPARMMSLGCGSAREIQLHLADPAAPDVPVTFTLIDQEAKALAYAYEASHPLTLKSKTHAKVQALNVSFSDVLRGGQWLDDVGPQDLIYSVGLLDYLVDRRAKSLCERLYERLRPGGLLIIGNMNETALSNIWPMEFITDWHLFYRTDADMRAWASSMKNAEAWTELEPTERVRLLFVRKRA